MIHVLKDKIFISFVLVWIPQDNELGTGGTGEPGGLPSVGVAQSQTRLE